MLAPKEEVEARILEFINSYSAEHHQAPGYREIAQAVGFKSTSSVHRFVKSLEEKGLLESKGRRGIVQPDEGRPSGIPLVGMIACGTPIYAEENVETYLSIDRLLLGKGEFFALRAKGDSMTGPASRTATS
ncbi:MAG: helix-turn-helix domain-containing protein [Clostridiales bacterium]|nr:helix-turn-helix domain-containing protein [Clostridiales bacterium]